MRCNAFLLFAFLCCTGLEAQQYVAFPTDSARWQCSYWAYQSICQTVPPHQYEYSISGDTVIGPFTYHKIISIGWTADANCYTPPTGYQGCIREDSARHVFFRPVWLGYDTLLYDFNLQVGDTMMSVLNTCLDPIDSIDSILIGSTYRKQYHITTSFWCGNFNVAIIEGIGSTGGLLEPFGQYMAHNNLNCFSHNGQTLYPYPAANCAPLIQSISPQPVKQEWSATPNPSSGSVVLTSPSLIYGQTYSVVLRNVTGEIVSVQSCNAQDGNISIDRSGVANGTYFAEVVNGEQTIGRVKLIFL